MKQLTEYHRYDKCRLEHKIPPPPSEAYGLFKSAPGKTVAYAPDASVTEGGIYLTDNIAEARRADVGVVLSCGADCPYNPGDTVAFVYGYALRIAGWESQDVALEGELRFYGSQGDSMEYSENQTTVAPRPCPWEEYALMVHQGEDVGWKPLGTNILLEIPEAHEKFGILYVAEVAKRDPVTAFIVSVGDKVKNFQPGQEVVYYAPACRRVSVNDKRYLIVDEEHAYTIVR